MTTVVTGERVNSTESSKDGMTNKSEEIRISGLSSETNIVTFTKFSGSPLFYLAWPSATFDFK